MTSLHEAPITASRRPRARAPSKNMSAFDRLIGKFPAYCFDEAKCLSLGLCRLRLRDDREPIQRGRDRRARAHPARPDGVETGGSARSSGLCPIPEDATAIHGIMTTTSPMRPHSPSRQGLLGLLEGCVFVAHNASFDLAILQHAFQAPGSNTGPRRSPAPSMLSGCSSRSPTITGSGRSASATASTRQRTDARATPLRPRVYGFCSSVTWRRSRRDSTSTRSCGSAPAATPGPRPNRRSGACSHSPASRGYRRDGRADRSKVCELVHRVAGVDEPELSPATGAGRLRRARTTEPNNATTEQRSPSHRRLGAARVKSDDHL